MTPAKLDLTIYQGATFKRILRLKDSNDVAIDLTGAEARMQVRGHVGDETPILELNDTNGRLVMTDPVNGEITLLVSNEDTAALDFSSGVYDLELAYSDFTVDRVLYGTVRLSKEVTR